MPWVNIAVRDASGVEHGQDVRHLQGMGVHGGAGRARRRMAVQAGHGGAWGGMAVQAGHGGTCKWDAVTGV